MLNSSNTNAADNHSSYFTEHILPSIIGRRERVHGGVDVQFTSKRLVNVENSYAYVVQSLAAAFYIECCPDCGVGAAIADPVHMVSPPMFAILQRFRKRRLDHCRQVDTRGRQAGMSAKLDLKWSSPTGVRAALKYIG